MNIQEIQTFLSERVKLPISEVTKLVISSKVKTFQKDENIFTQGELGKSLFLMVGGLAYVYYLHPKGLEKVKRFVVRGDSLAPLVSLLTNEPSNYSAKAIEKCICLEIKYEDYRKLLSKSWLIETFYRQELEKQVIERELKEYELFMFSAEERYQSFLSRHKKISDQIPLRLVASYINVDPATLSRIRKSSKLT